MEEINKREKCLIMIIIGLAVFFIGATCNFVVLRDNGGRMPVKTQNYVIDDETHFDYTLDSEVEHAILSDRIKIGKNIASIGDIIIIAAGFFIVILCVVSAFQYWKLNRKKKNENKRKHL